MGSGFLAQGVVVCNRCDSGITLFAIQSATADQLIHVPLLTSICIYLISVHIPIALIFLRCFSTSAYTIHILALFSQGSRSGGHVMLADRQTHQMEELLENLISNRVRNSG